LTPACINEGGPASLVRLAEIPELETEVVLPSTAVAALRRWQARAGEIVTVVDPEQTFYRARLTSLEPGQVRAVPFEKSLRPLESRVEIAVYQALPEKERFELILQKLTEIGVTRVVPYVSRRSVTLEERDAGQRKSHRWPEVILRAARQCRRAMLPELYPVVSWDEATYLANQTDLKLMLFEGDAPWTLKEALNGARPDRVALLVGPEGGFSPEEVEDVRGMGFLPVSVGPRILRTETAAIVGAALLQYALGDLG
jgi:16S rRNA (uracil1498-N3)-methyltransferase